MQRRNTLQKELILQAVRGMNDHPTADAVYQRVHTDYPSVSKATVYRNLNQMAEDGLIRRVEIPNSADRYDFTVKAHYHMRCVQCQKVYDVSVPYMEKLDENIADMPDLLIFRHNIIFEGICKSCRNSHTKDLSCYLSK